MPEIVTFAWALLNYWMVIVGGTLVVLLVALWERKHQDEPHWQIYARVLLVLFATAVLLAGRDVFREYARTGKQFSDAGPLKGTIDYWQTTFGETLAERDFPIRRFRIDETTAQRIDFDAPPTETQLAERNADAGTSQSVSPDALSVDDSSKNGRTVSQTQLSSSLSIGDIRVPDGLWADVREVPSGRDDMPYSLELTVHVNGIVQPFGVVLTAIGVVDDAAFEVLGQRVYTMVLKGHIKDRPDQYYIGFDSPAVSPPAPLIITLRARQRIRIARIDRVYLPHG